MALGRLLVVSNRVPDPDGPASAGGLVSAVRPALETDGGTWFGWSGRAGAAHHPTRFTRWNGVEYATVDLTPQEIRDYYEGFCNEVLWPTLHGRPRGRPTSAVRQYVTWRIVNRRFAHRAATLLRADSVVIVQDYHLIPLGLELRRLGWGGHLGYFHHVPVPAADEWETLPFAPLIADAFSAYDLVGVQTAADATRLRAIVGDDAPCRIAAHSIGIDVDEVRAMAAEHHGDAFATLRGSGRRILFGVDRMDYTKGIPQRLAAFEQLLTRNPELSDKLRLVQWAAPSREAIGAYHAERLATEALVARINQRFPDDDPPVTYAYRNHPRDAVVAALRDADICLVTSVADGMNLVAKEFVAVQRPEDPGVLVLTRGCGASVELRDAVVVDVAEPATIEHAIRTALALPLDERRERWSRMRAAVETNTAGHWLARFVDDLVYAGYPPRRSPPPRPVAGAAAAH